MEQSKFYQIKNITEHEYILVGCDGSVITRSIQDVDKSASVFTIQDAKDGDVLANNGNIILFKQISDSARPDYKFIQSYCFALTHSFDFYLSGTYNLDDGFHPAIKEQRDTLFARMKEVGYEWDAEKKDLKKIEQSPDDDIERKYNPCYNMSFEEAQEYISNRGFDIPWTDCDVFIDFRYVTQTIANILCWADDNPNQKPAWSEEDELHLKDAIHAAYSPDCGGDELIDWLKSLKDRVQPQPKQEWSEEDEKMIQDIINDIAIAQEQVYCKSRCEDEINWLKSLRPQKQWKPSEEQMEALDSAIHCYAGISPTNNREVYALEIMKEQLKKLKGE